MKAPAQAPMFYIGASKEAVAEAGKVILFILDSNADQSTIVKALDVLQHTCSVNNVTVNNCTFTSTSKI